MKKEEWPYFEGFGKKTCMFHGGVPHRPFWRKTRTPSAAVGELPGKTGKTARILIV